MLKGPIEVINNVIVYDYLLVHCMSYTNISATRYLNQFSPLNHKYLIQ